MWTHLITYVMGLIMENVLKNNILKPVFLHVAQPGLFHRHM